MCGIAGFFTESVVFSRQDLEKMTRALTHRGPDAEGFFMDGETGLGHRRLSILDLSDAGNQPMYSHDKRYVIIYNGEVYNFQEIANELNSDPSHGRINFTSSSDTEVILEAFARWGPSCVDKLNGMFTFAVYDLQDKTLHIVRDRLGIKPLFYFWDGKNLAFASELKSLLTCPSIPRRLNRKAFAPFFNLGFIPAPQTIYESIYKMEAGSVMRIDKNGLQISRYWSPDSIASEEVLDNEKKALIRLSELLKSSVQYQLKSDVPFGVFLSGGIDSSLITAEAVNLSSVKVNTFSIGFEENRYNESAFAKAIAEYLGTNHHEFIVSYRDAIGLIDTIFEAYDEPFADSSAIPTLLVSQLARKHVTVTLSGEGGDELFHGYGSYTWAGRLHDPLIRAARKPIAKVLASSSKNRLQRASRLFMVDDYEYIHSHIHSQEQYLFSLGEIRALMYDTGGYSPPVINVKKPGRTRKFTDAELQSLYDINYYLPYDLLTKVDRASMHHSLETRVPYLDHRLVEFAINLSPRLKNKDGISKYVLKEILYQYVPEKFFRRPKQGFAIPLEQWLKKELRYLEEEFLSDEVIDRFGIVRKEEVKKLRTEFAAGRSFLYNRLWALIVLHKWMTKNCPA
ncbi:MAG TPA: asparagine synthase (glutamine-hydrolyzing) [Bacteroidia bacterium]